MGADSDRRQISYQSPPTHTLFQHSVHRHNAYHQGNPLITTATHSIAARCTKKQSFRWQQARSHISTTYLNKLSVNQLVALQTCRSHTQLHSTKPRNHSETLGNLIQCYVVQPTYSRVQNIELYPCSNILHCDLILWLFEYIQNSHVHDRPDNRRSDSTVMLLYTTFRSLTNVFSSSNVFTIQTQRQIIGQT